MLKNGCLLRFLKEVIANLPVWGWRWSTADKKLRYKDYDKHRRRKNLVLVIFYSKSLR
jgi:hypothetical protein